MKTIKKTLIIFSLILTISCNKNSVKTAFPNNPELPSILNYFDISSKRTNAAFGVTFSTPMIDKTNTNGPILFQGLFLANNGPAIKGGKVTFGNYSFLSDDNGYYGSGIILNNDIIGKKQPISFQKPISFDVTANIAPSATNLLGSTTTDSLYVPKLLEITSGEPTSNEISQNTMRVGHIFTWKTDPANINKGVIIGVEYYPDNFMNTAFKGIQPELIKHGKVIEDNGNFSLEQSFFINIPVGALVQVTIARANYILGTDTESTPYTLFAYNFKFGDYIFLGN